MEQRKLRKLRCGCQFPWCALSPLQLDVKLTYLGYGLEDRGIGVEFSAEARDVSLPHGVLDAS
jgi:hypothetical protein